MITYGLAVSEAWASSYRDTAQADLTQATLAAATDDDRKPLACSRTNSTRWRGGPPTLCGAASTQRSEDDRSELPAKRPNPWRKSIIAVSL